MKKTFITISSLSISLLYVDLFCGAGGTSTGVESARIENEKCAMVVGCVNHDANAIASHSANHPDAIHFTEDIRTLDLTGLKQHTEKARKQYPFAKLILWASLECTNFSKAKGGQARDADSRTLAEHLFRYIEDLNPDCVQIENVEEFMSWGKVCELGKPVSRDKGRDFMRWINNVKAYGYSYDHRILNAADYGALTSRRRYFAQFAKPDFPIVWPEQTHMKNGNQDGLFNDLQKWRPVREVLDFEDEGVSIFARKKPLSEKTLERIYAGLVKFVAGGQKNFIKKYYSGRPNGKVCSTEDPCGTITTVANMALVQTNFLSAYYGNGNNVSSVERPSPTVTTKDRLSKVQCNFIDQQFGASTPASIENVLGALTTNPKYAKVCTEFIMNQYSGGGQVSDIENPSPAILSTPKQNLISCKPWIMDTAFSNVGSNIDEPSKTITANRKWHYLMNPQFNSAGGSVDNPAFTLIARMDKMPPYLVAAENGNIAIVISENDSDNTVKIKEFMAAYGIMDIKMRMLKIPELKQIMGFPRDYILLGTQADQKKFIGNAVEVTMARKICEATANKLIKIRKAA